MLRVLAGEFPAGYGSWARERSSLSEAQVVGVVLKLKILAMMAAEVLRELDEGSVG